MGFLGLRRFQNAGSSLVSQVQRVMPTIITNPLQISEMRKQTYPGSDITVEDTLDPGSNYQRYYVSYKSDGLKIYALMTVPNGTKPVTGWPVIVFNHGFIPPAEYKTTERYIAYVDGFARSGYIVFRSDYRGHDQSEGAAGGAYSSPGYTNDVLNAVASLKKYKDTDPERIGMWGHSMGGYITLRSMVVTNDIKAGVIWGGVVAPYTDLISGWRRGPPGTTPNPPPTGSLSRGWRGSLASLYGSPQQNPEFWKSISANSYVSEISGPIQLHHSTTDETVPVEFSQTLNKELEAASKTVEYYEYPGDNHNINANFNIAMQRSIEFFDKYVKASS